MQATEDWDDLQEMESQACGTLTHVLDKTVAPGAHADNDHASRSFINVVGDSPQPQKRRANVVELDSSDDEDMHCSVPRGKSVVTQYFYFVFSFLFYLFKYLQIAVSKISSVIFFNLPVISILFTNYFLIVRAFWKIKEKKVIHIVIFDALFNRVLNI